MWEIILKFYWVSCLRFCNLLIKFWLADLDVHLQYSTGTVTFDPCFSMYLPYLVTILICYTVRGTSWDLPYLHATSQLLLLRSTNPFLRADMLQFFWLVIRRSVGSFACWHNIWQPSSFWTSSVYRSGNLVDMVKSRIRTEHSWKYRYL